MTVEEEFEELIKQLELDWDTQDKKPEKVVRQPFSTEPPKPKYEYCSCAEPKVIRNEADREQFWVCKKCKNEWLDNG